MYLPTATNPNREPKWANGTIVRYEDGDLPPGDTDCRGYITRRPFPRVVDSMGYYWVELDFRDVNGIALRCIARAEDFRVMRRLPYETVRHAGTGSGHDGR